jgi:hypothetical protein
VLPCTLNSHQKILCQWARFRTRESSGGRGPLTILRTIQLSIPGSVAASLLCLSAAVCIVRAGTAAFRGSAGDVSSLLRATDVTPSDASLWRRAGLKLLEADPERARTYLHRAVQLNSWDADALLGLAFLSEKSGEIAGAERYYRVATQVSRRFKPQYALAAFYFRQDRRSFFWAPASMAAAVPSADLQRLFLIAHQVSDHPREVSRLLKLESQHSLASYFTFLLTDGHLDQLAEIGDRIEPFGAQRDLLLNACERLLDAGRMADAAQLWNRLGKHGNQAFTHIDPYNGHALANGAFLPAPMRGFNWRSYGMPGTRVNTVEPSGLRIEFSGEQPQNGGIINQPLWLLPERRYQLHYRSGQSSLSSPEGLQWALLAGNQVVAIAPWRNGSLEGSFEFDAPAEPSRLILRYVRSPGTVRSRGSLTLQYAELICLP